MKNTQDKYRTVLNEADEFFTQKYGHGILNESIHDILSNDVAFSQYKEKLTEGADPESAEQLSTMMDNTRSEILTEAYTSNISNFASLTMPILVKLWARLTMTQAIPTEPVDVPAFTVPWIKPYIKGHDGQKYVRLVA